jgi:hypothetical protein
MAPHDLSGGSIDHSNGSIPNGGTTSHLTQHDKPQHGTNGSATTTTSDKLEDRLAVHRSTKDFGSYAYSLVSLPAGSLFTKITGTTSGTKAYSSVQTGPDTHIELNSDLLYCNQSCDPSLEFDMATFEVRVSRERDLKAGDALTFWYPSTEWSMAQPFKCECGSAKCKGYINGAGQMEESVVRGYWLNEHIEKMLAERAEKNNVANGASNGH